MIRTVLGVVFDDEDRRFGPIWTFWDALHQLAYCVIRIGNHRSGSKAAWPRPGGVVLGKAHHHVAWQALARILGIKILFKPIQLREEHSNVVGIAHSRQLEFRRDM